MMKSVLPYFTLLLLVSIGFQAEAQAPTWDKVYTILNTKCAGSGCHSTLQGFKVDSPKTVLYNALINKTPFNPYADSIGDKLVLPGYPHKSFLLKKIAHGLPTVSTDIQMVSQMAGVMPIGRPALSAYEIETIRQWILAGASETENYPTADSTMIATYYNDPNRLPFLQAPAAPAPGEGFQVHLGPIFFNPGEESEFFLKYDLFAKEHMNVSGLEVTMNDESHHYILRKFADGKKADWDEGLEPLNPVTAFDSDKDYVMAWQGDQNFYLPKTTAYFWDSTTALDLNFHMFNYNAKILPGEVYMNVYTEPDSSILKEMKSDLVNNLAFFIPANQTQTFSATSNLKDVSIWTLTSHTHSRGTDFNIFLRNTVGGGKGQALFEGKVDYSTGTNLGIYDWEHPPTRFWDDLNTIFFDSLDVNGDPMYNGFIYEAEYTNNDNKNYTFGFTTEDEMMIYYIQYVNGYYKAPVDTTTPNDTDSVTGLNNLLLEADKISLYPNPTNDAAYLNYTLTKPGNVQISVYDLVGKETQFVSAEGQPAGEYTVRLDANDLGPNGVYFVKINIDGSEFTKKLVKTNR